MGKVEFTPAQKRVIGIRNKNVLVSAAAGSGKTAVLTARIVDRICDKDHPVSIDRLLIVTFTEAAANEMREKIVAAIGKRMREEPGNEFLKKQYTLAHSALIMTVHGFCLFLIRNHFDQIGIDPSFRVGSPEEVKILLEDALDEAILKLQKDFPEEYERLQAHFDCGFSDDRIKVLLRKLFEVVSGSPFPKQWFLRMNETLKEFEKDPENSDVYGFAYEYETEILKDLLSDMNRALFLAREDGGPSKYIPVFEKEKAVVHNLLSKSSIRERSALYQTLSFDRIPTVKDTDPNIIPQLKKEAKDLRDSWKEALTGLQKSLYLFPVDTAVSDDLENVRTLLILLRLEEILYSIFEQKKRRKNLIDFSDMEHFALQILLKEEDGVYVPSDVALSYREFFEEVMVDEYQDSNFIQETLLNAVSRIDETCGNRFMVGDVKQSIYRFRQAKPEIFRNKFDIYTKVDLSVEKDPEERDVRIDLSKNFRSRAEVLDSVNHVFEDTMHRSVGEIEYDADAKLYLGASYPVTEQGHNRTELFVLPREDWGEYELKGDINQEAVTCGSRIRKMVEEGFLVTDKNPDTDEVFLRPVKYSDIIILLKKTAGKVEKIKAVLEEMGIPAVVLSKEGYFATPEILLMTDFISIIDNPRQDIPLLGVMHSFIGGFAESELAKIKCPVKGKKELLYDALKDYVKDGKEEVLRKKTEAFLNKLNAYRTCSDRMGVYDLLVHIMEKESVISHFRALNGGEQRVANLRILLQKAREFSSTGYSGIFTFIQYIDNIKSREIDFGEANILDENADVVRIFTMHKSKGLEFPVCFLLGLGENLSKSADKKEIVVDDLLGIGTDYTNPTDRVKHKSFVKNVILLKEKKEQRGEDLRLLYVAMTRAKEKLILIGTASNELMGKATQFGPNRNFTASEILSAGSFLEFLFPEAKRNPSLFDLVLYKPEDAIFEKKKDAFNRAALKEELFRIPAGKMPEFDSCSDAMLRRVHTKISVSDLKNAAYTEEEEAVVEMFPEKEQSDDFLDDDSVKESVAAKEVKKHCVPAFMRGAESQHDGAKHGTAFHRIMELLDFSNLSEIMEQNHQNSESNDFEEKATKAIDRMRDDLAADYALSEEENRLIRTTDVVTFLQSGAAYRMMKADGFGKLYREQPFVISVPATEINLDLPKDEKTLTMLKKERVLIQGIIDVYFEEDDALVLLDYKTDSKPEEELIKRYRPQLAYYAKALGMLERKPVKEILIYSTHLRKVIPVDFDKTM